MHHLLTGWPMVDHRNGNGLDNRRANLRPATVAQNNANVGLRRDNSSGFKGVSRHRGRWIARIGKNGAIRLGMFDDPADAARAYDAAARELFGEFARLNFPGGERSMSTATPLVTEARRGNYVRQNNGGMMTPRQRRRWKHKLNRALLAQHKAESR